LDEPTPGAAIKRFQWNTWMHGGTAVADFVVDPDLP
jgi:hypothetical protein